MIRKLKRIIAGMLAAITLVTAMPVVGVNAASDGDKEKATIETLGKLGTVKIGSKSEGGTWVKTLVEEMMFFVLIWEKHVTQVIRM